MKKSTQAAFMLLTFLLLSWNASAQNAIGGKLGVHFGTWKGVEDLFGLDPKYVAGTNVGLVFQIGLNDIISIQPELLYMQKGFRFEESSDKLLYKLNYLEVPVLVKLSFPISESMGLFVNAGPSIGYAINGKIIYFEDGDKETEEIEFEDEDEFNRTDVSMAFGGGASFNVSSVKLLLEARYLYGFSNLDDSDEEKFYNRGVGITAGIMVPF